MIKKERIRKLYNLPLEENIEKEEKQFWSFGYNMAIGETSARAIFPVKKRNMKYIQRHIEAWMKKQPQHPELNTSINLTNP